MRRAQGEKRKAACELSGHFDVNSIGLTRPRCSSCLERYRNMLKSIAICAEHPRTHRWGGPVQKKVEPERKPTNAPLAVAAICIVMLYLCSSLCDVLLQED